MFTFGREHEKSCAANYVRNPGQIALIHNVIDAVHDLLERNIEAETCGSVLAEAFADGGSGIWEQTGTWLARLYLEYPEIELQWINLANSSSWKIRWRIAPFVRDLPVGLRRRLFLLLLNDSSSSVRRKIVGDVYHCLDSYISEHLYKRLEVETNTKVIESISFVLQPKV
jgi:hypothetical protein